MYIGNIYLNNNLPFIERIARLILVGFDKNKIKELTGVTSDHNLNLFIRAAEKSIEEWYK